MRRPLRTGWWRAPLLGTLVAAVALRGGAWRHDDGGDPERLYAGATLRARVTEVTDGDTVAVALEDGRSERVRYIGVDTPESNPHEPIQCFGPEAKAANERLVGGRQVVLVVGAEARDDYGRLLAYVHRPAPRGAGFFVNAALVRRGFARTLTIAPNDERAALLRRLESAAGRAGRGLWGVCGR
ncbi:MAG: nuclease (SNase domain protein) [Solirubrobacterales bacterium]|nr:nuclease (SNase domain protein) [Solirubrobacterales bacterium]